MMQSPILYIYTHTGNKELPPSDLLPDAIQFDKRDLPASLSFTHVFDPNPSFALYLNSCKEGDRKWRLILARPVDTDYRAAILGAFNRHTIRSLGEINNHLKEVGEYKSYQSTRRILEKLCKEKLLTKLPQRGDKNAAMYSKLVFTQSARFVGRDGNVTTTEQYLSELVSEDFPEVIDKQAAIVIKQWMLDTIASAYPEGYTGKREYPDERQIKRKLEGTLRMLSNMHAYLRAFLDSGVYTPVARDILAEQFQKELAMFHVVIVERTWDKAE